MVSQYGCAQTKSPVAKTALGCTAFNQSEVVAFLLPWCPSFRAYAFKNDPLSPSPKLSTISCSTLPSASPIRMTLRAESSSSNIRHRLLGFGGTELFFGTFELRR